jgi:3-hydroxyisobutyrate dehydrogenase
MLPSTPQVESVYLDPEVGVLAGLKDLPVDTPPLESPVPNPHESGSSESDGSTESSVKAQRGSAYENEPHTLLIDQTTLDPTFAITLAERVQSETLGRALMLDAPVSGGTCSQHQMCAVTEAETSVRDRRGWEWEADHHVWVTFGAGLVARGTASTAHGS